MGLILASNGISAVTNSAIASPSLIFLFIGTHSMEQWENTLPGYAS